METFTLRRAGCGPLAPFALGASIRRLGAAAPATPRRRRASAVGLSAGVRGFVALLRYGPKGAPPWQPAREPTPDEVYEPGMLCPHCGMPHAELICRGCGERGHTELICDRCTYTEPFNPMELSRIRTWRVRTAIALALAVGTLAGAALGGRRRG